VLTGKEITHAEALDLIEEHLGEKVYLGFLVSRADETGELVPVDHHVGPLVNLLDPKPPRLEPDEGFYAVGGFDGAYHLPPMVGSVFIRDSGIDFRVADGVIIRLAWRGSSEIGHPIDVP
jgi:hypothetical protein